MKKLIFAALLFTLSTLQVWGQYYEVPKRKLAPATMNIFCYGMFSKGTDGLFHYEAFDKPQVLTDRSFYDSSIGNERYFGYSKEEKMYFFFTDNFLTSAILTFPDRGAAQNSEKQGVLRIFGG